MIKKRIISRIDIKNENVIKGIHLEGQRKIGDPDTISQKYYHDGIDEIIFMDSVAAFYDRNSLSEIIKNASRNVFVPVTVGGGIRSLHDIGQALQSGADKVAINTQAVRNKKFILEAVNYFGSQCIVGSIEAKRRNGMWEAYVENGREQTGLNALEWAKELEQLGIGEMIITSVDAEGTKKGFDLELTEAIMKQVNIPVIACGGAGSVQDITSLFKQTNADAVALASVLHYNIESVQSIKKQLNENGVLVRL